MLNQIGVLTIRVNNLKEAITFYTEALGFEVARHYGEKLVSLKHDGLPLVLEETGGIRKFAEQCPAWTHRQEFRRGDRGIKISRL
ncbi:hypothetical protein CU633_13390 [Bacillus sp. V3-13]|uniref:VOC family protein n=1 Tax=Bacillus sp. V3-13 TaxID=2053728 RepID=UPI000C790C79|nr:VOC family protein [Bacillus sp. V3-13]PLR76894.1 hypothetical protein CU633_13390 [Bacillus sp. V3-13]